MICTNCQTENRAESRFCRSCGSKLNAPPVRFTITIPHISLSSIKHRALGLIRKFKGGNSDRKRVFAAIIASFFLVGTVYAGPKVGDTLKVNGLIKEAAESEARGDYQAALAALSVSEGKWMSDAKRQKVQELKKAEEKNIEYKQAYDKALSLRAKGSLAEARQQLKSIGLEYPQYSDVRGELDTVQEAIEGNLKESARQRELEAAEARRRTQEEANARSRAEAERASSEAQARAAAQAAREAEAERAEQVRRSFRSELISGYNSFAQAKTYYGSAIKYSNAGESLLALSQANSARAVLNSAYSAVSDLNTRFTGLNTSYYSAASSLMSAIRNLNGAIDYLVKSEGTSLDYSSYINDYKDTALYYEKLVREFIDSN